ncbi:MAG: sigma-54-dependent transcriptional regulator [Bradymonadia bacterium]
MSTQASVQPTLLIVDDDVSNLASLVKVFDKLAVRVIAATSGEEAIKSVRDTPVDIILTDLMMPGMDGIELLKNVKAIAPDTEVIMMTAYATIERAVEAMRQGAYDFVTKPFRRVQIERVIKRGLEKQHLLAENKALKAELATVRSHTSNSGIIGNAAPLRKVLDVARQASPSTATVLLMGESGTGKELFARFIHENSTRSENAFVAINCGALPDSIIEAELFGADKGAFTGAHVSRDGLFARANGGTLFLDEVSELSPHVQVKLLRVIQSGEYNRVGGQETLQSNCRIVAASNKNLEQMVEQKLFREDLYYRLNVIPITLPPLRERAEDIPLLADHFLRLYAAKNGKDGIALSQQALSALCLQRWPGNVRQLENTIERSVVLSVDPIIDREHLPGIDTPTSDEIQSLRIPIGTPMDEIERRVIQATLQLTEGDKRRAAQLLGIGIRTIYRKV